MQRSILVKKMNPLVSVAIPVYNGANYMREAIDSVLAQTYPNMDILVVNDGSRDDGATEDIALSYGHRVRYFSQAQRRRCFGLESSHCKKRKAIIFVGFRMTTSIFRKKVTKEMETLLSLPDANAVVFCRHSIMNAPREVSVQCSSTSRISPGQAAYQLMLRQWLHCCTILAPRSLYLESGGFREDLPTTQDYDLLVKIGLKHPFIELPEVLLKARSALGTRLFDAWTSE